MDETTQYPYSLKFSLGTIVLMLALMLLLLSNTIRANNTFSWILYGVFAVLFILLLALLILKRLVPALKNEVALALDEEGISDYIRDISIEWKNIKEITLVRGRSASTLQVDLKFESDYGKQIGIPLRWVKGKDDDIYDTVMAYFENAEPTDDDSQNH